MTIIESIRDFIKQCPYLSDYYKSIGVDYLADTTVSYSIEEVPVDPIVKTYVNGDKLKQYVFIFCSKEDYSSDVRQNIENSGFYEEFEEWLSRTTRSRNLPIMSDGKEAQSIKAITSGYAFATDGDKAQYQIQVRLEYYQKSIGVM